MAASAAKRPRSEGQEDVSGTAQSTAPAMVLIVCDLQEKFRPHIHGFDSIEGTAVFMINAFKLLGLPIIVTRQVPSKLGPLTDVVQEATEGCTALAVDKKSFSCLTPEVVQYLEAAGNPPVALVGLETHICVLQTAKAAAALDIPVTIVADGVSSYTTFQRTTALVQAGSLPGIQVGGAESLAFELLGGATHPAFKALQGCVKDYRAFCSDKPHALM